MIRKIYLIFLYPVNINEENPRNNENVFRNGQINLQNHNVTSMLGFKTLNEDINAHTRT